MHSKQCKHPNASVLASAPVMLLREKGHVARVIVGDLSTRGRVLLSCSDCGMLADLLTGIKYASEGQKKVIERGNQEKNLVPTVITMRTVVQEVQARLTSLSDPLDLEMLDDLLLLLLSLHADGSPLIGRHALWNGQLVPVRAIEGHNITVPGNVGLQVVLFCEECRQGQDTFFLISSLALGDSHLPQSRKGHYTRAVNSAGNFVFNLERTGYYCPSCMKSGEGNTVTRVDDAE